MVTTNFAAHLVVLATILLNIKSETVLCDASSTCFCSDDNSECIMICDDCNTDNLYCTDYQPCSVSCSTTSDCRYSEIYGKNATSLNVDCDDCTQIQIHAEQVPNVTINCRNCYEADIYCGSDICDIDCGTTSSDCRNINIFGDKLENLTVNCYLCSGMHAYAQNARNVSVDCDNCYQSEIYCGSGICDIDCNKTTSDCRYSNIYANKSESLTVNCYLCSGIQAYAQQARKVSINCDNCYQSEIYCGTGICDIDCSITTSDCRYSNIFANESEELIVDCYLCTGIRMDAEQATNVSVTCNSCYEADINCGSGICDINCAPFSDCRYMDTDCGYSDLCSIHCGGTCTDLEVIGVEATNVSVECKMTSSCYNADIYCGSGVCSVDCKGNASNGECQYTHIDCATSKCDIQCGDNDACGSVSINATTANSFQCIGEDIDCNNIALYTSPPTGIPTFLPTTIPTLNTTYPTNNPSKYPSFLPTISPTNNPTYLEPSLFPSISTSTDPSNNPTNSPTKQSPKTPSISPSESSSMVITDSTITITSNTKNNQNETTIAETNIPYWLYAVAALFTICLMISVIVFCRMYCKRKSRVDIKQNVSDQMVLSTSERQQDQLIEQHPANNSCVKTSGANCINPKKAATNLMKIEMVNFMVNDATSNPDVNGIIDDINAITLGYDDHNHNDKIVITDEGLKNQANIGDDEFIVNDNDVYTAGNDNKLKQAIDTESEGTDETDEINDETVGNDLQQQTIQ